MQLADVASTWYPAMRLRSGRGYILTKDSIDDPHGMRDLCNVHGTCTGRTIPSLSNPLSLRMGPSSEGPKGPGTGPHGGETLYP